MESNIQLLNSKYKELTPRERIEQIFYDFEPDKVLVTSSFGTSSAYLLSLISQVRKDVKIHFVDTNYHFKATLAYKKQLQELFDLEIIDLKPYALGNDFTTKNETWKTDPDFCCWVNKVNPVEAVKGNFDLWISGLMSFQNSYRKERPMFEQNGVLKFYPVLDVRKEEVKEFIQLHSLPAHPLVARGFESVGCTHCTVKGEGRSGRWADTGKNECGLHTYNDEDEDRNLN